MIGILGGTFDPIHLGHLRPALEVQEALGLEALRFVPLRQAVHREAPYASGEDRLAMVQAAIAGERSFVADRRELDRSGGSYTLDTLGSMREELGADLPLCLLLGSDAFGGFLSWHRPLDILALAHLVVMTRPGVEDTWSPEIRALRRARQVASAAALSESPGGHIYYQRVTQLDISATAIRESIAAGRSPRFLVPDPVIEIIAQRGLYRDCV